MIIGWRVNQHRVVVTAPYFIYFNDFITLNTIKLIINRNLLLIY
jgi:hypothetical protein